ncbi:hypothetical protein JZ751_024875 [Albula glossodonta]|uniref:Uncharacterized protein n=1 Tax=Albula glossodonta TaxID=121402 RepID=A0A8T2PGY3_9TELE|nr:hypothetical protein JZ751_024875 [Albula glossodonta]
MRENVFGVKGPLFLFLLADRQTETCLATDRVWRQNGRCALPRRKCSKSSSARLVPATPSAFVAKFRSLSAPCLTPAEQTNGMLGAAWLPTNQRLVAMLEEGTNGRQGPERDRLISPPWPLDTGGIAPLCPDRTQSLPYQAEGWRCLSEPLRSAVGVRR